jgi:hypothetical protein
MDHAPRVRVGHRLGDRFEDREEPRPVVRRVLAVGEQGGQGTPPDQLHGEVGAGVAEGAELVNRDDPGVLELTADLGFLDEPANTGGLVLVPSRSTLIASSRPRSGSRPLRIAPMPPRAISPKT